MISPIFDQVHPTDTCPCVRVGIDPATGAVVNMHREVLERSQATPVHSIEDAEDLVFSLAQPVAVPSANVAVLAVGLMRVSNTIAAKTRQSAGDTIFLHPELLQQMLASPFAGGPNTDPSEPTITVGRWTKEGTLNGLTVYTSPHLWKTDAYVMALASRFAALFEHDGQLSVDVFRPMTTCLGDARDYIGKLKGPELVALWISPSK